jgi:hypothetical protein
MVYFAQPRSSPTQVFLKVSGAHGGCESVGQVRVVLEGDHFNVTLYNGTFALHGWGSVSRLEV